MTMLKYILAFLISALPGLLAGQNFIDDIGVVSLVSPSCFQDADNNVQVVIRIKNEGSDAQANFSVYYTLDDNLPEEEIFPWSILPGEIKTFTFAVNADFSYPACHTLIIGCSLPGDQNSVNDTRTYPIMVPVYPVITTVLHPLMSEFQTGSTNGQAFTQNSLVKFKGANMEVGWITFPLDSVPPAVSILGAQLQLHTIGPFTSESFMLKRTALNPITSSPQQVYDSITTGYNYMLCRPPIDSAQTLTFELPQTAIYDLRCLLNTGGNFTIGFSDNSGDTAHHGTFGGWGQGILLKPSLILKYVSTLVQDPGIISIDIDTSTYVYGVITPRASVHNYGYMPADFKLTATSNTGYYSFKWIIGLPPATSLQVQFAPWTAVPDEVCFNLSMFMPPDQNCSNNEASLCWNNSLHSDVFGKIKYTNIWHTIMHDSVLAVLIPYNPAGLIKTDTVDDEGNYHFENVPPGNYSLLAYSFKHWGGGNATDGLVILKHFVGLSLLSGLNLRAADVNADALVNTVDALMVVRRFVGTIPSFPADDWITEEKYITVPSGTYLPVDIHVICTGDVNGSYVP